MIKEYLATPLIKLGIKILDDTIPVEKIHQFLTEGLENFLLASEKYPNIFSAIDLQKIELAAALFKASQSFPLPPETKLSSFPLSSLEKPEVIAWIEALPKKRLISFKGLMPRGGEVMLWLYENHSEEMNEFFETQLERVLRTVEVKRKNALDHSRSGFEYLQAMDQQAIAILFCRLARERNDIRFLNAALKLNDWAFPAYQKIKAGRALVDYLLSLAEAEFSCKELLS